MRITYIEYDNCDGLAVARHSQIQCDTLERQSQNDVRIAFLPAQLLRSSLAPGSGGFSVEVLDALQHAHQAAQSSSPRLEYLNRQSATEIEAIAAAIIPSGDTAGAIFFIDRALATFDQDHRETYSKGLAAAQEKRRDLFPNSQSIGALTDKQVIRLIESIEKTAFFEILRTHVVIGFLANPQYGGNRGRLAWKLIGFDDAGSFQPPFGYYDGPGNPE